MANEEKSALEIILMLPELLSKLDSKINSLDTNLKILNSKFNKIKNINEVQVKQEEYEEKKDLLARKPTAEPGAKPVQQQKIQKNDIQKLVIGPIKVFSYVKTISKKPVDDMMINIFDSENDLIKSLRTDKDGYWEAKLPPGKFSIEMIHPKLKIINKSIELSKEMSTYEVL